jgi:uncharacterized membrane protein YesL
VNVQEVLLVMTLGAALLALWVDVRFPRFAPADIWSALVRLTLALAVGYLVAPLMTLVVRAGGSPALALLGIALPALVLFFLAGFWIVRSVQGTLFGVRR